jgi:hypothetical protein
MINVEDLLKYLKEKIPNFTKTSKRGQILITCPRESEHKFKTNSPTMTTIPGSDKYYCLSCGFKGTIYDLIRLVEKKPALTDAEVISFMTDIMKCDIYPELDTYKKYEWSLIPIAKNGKIPLEKGWTESEHKEKSEWLNWAEQGLNLGIRTGEVSGITVIDVDLKIAPTGELEEIYKLLAATKTLKQNSPKGVHFIFKYDKDLKQTSKIGNVTIDIRNDGGQVLCSPSKINNLNYSWVNLGSDIKDVSPELKSKLLESMKADLGRSEKMSPEMSQIINNPIELKGNNLEGQCNDTFVCFGGVLIKMGLSIDIVKGILFYLNKNWLKNPMPTNVIEAMLGSLEGYRGTEDQTQEKSIYDACQIIQTDISAKDIIDHVFPGDNKKRAIVDKYLAKLHKEGKLSRRGRGRYDCKQAVEWVNELQEQSKEINYKIPYFDDVAYFRNGDIILIGAPTGKGKTTIAINFIKQMKVQGIIPFYLSLEAGSRHEKTANLLGLTQKDYYIPKETVTNPLQIEIEPNSFSIIDWLYMGDDFAQTQAVFKHLNDEMVRKQGILVVFTQLKEDYNWFAVNLIKSFPRFAARFVYDDETGLVSHFDVCKITDPKGHYQNAIISTEFNFSTKELIKKNNL